MRRHFILKNQDGSVICDRCVVADRPLSRLRGLLGRHELPESEGLLITPESSIHTWFMRFPIDVVFLDATLTVLGTRENVGSWRVAGWRGARSVLELPAGACQQRKLRPGDRLVLDDCTDEDAEVLLVLRRG